MIKDHAKISKCGRRKSLIVRVWRWYFVPSHYVIYTWRRHKPEQAYTWREAFPMVAKEHDAALALQADWLERGVIAGNQIQRVFNELTEGAV